MTADYRWNQCQFWWFHAIWRRAGIFFNFSSWVA